MGPEPPVSDLVMLFSGAHLLQFEPVKTSTPYLDFCQIYNDKNRLVVNIN